MLYSPDVSGIAPAQTLVQVWGGYHVSGTERLRGWGRHGCIAWINQRAVCTALLT